MTYQPHQSEDLTLKVGDSTFTVLKLSETHEWRLRGRRWELHYLPADDGMPLRTASRFEAELLDAAKREVDAVKDKTK